NIHPLNHQNQTLQRTFPPISHLLILFASGLGLLSLRIPIRLTDPTAVFSASSRLDGDGSNVNSN
ncbi:MAG: hypothetical protein AAF639_07695, partial [Chloroflexota bacterium]